METNNLHDHFALVMGGFKVLSALSGICAAAVYFEYLEPLITVFNILESMFRTFLCFLESTWPVLSTNQVCGVFFVVVLVLGVLLYIVYWFNKKDVMLLDKKQPVSIMILIAVFVPPGITVFTVFLLIFAYWIAFYTFSRPNQVEWAIEVRATYYATKSWCKRAYMDFKMRLASCFLPYDALFFYNLEKDFDIKVDNKSKWLKANGGDDELVMHW